MKYVLIVFLILSLLLVIVVYNFKARTIEIAPNTFLVDVRSPREFKTGSVPNAINIPLGEVENSIDKFTGKENIVVFCGSGFRSWRAQKKLEAHRIQNVTNGVSWKKVQAALDDNQ